MARKVRMEYPGVIYPPPSFEPPRTGVLNRGDRHVPISHNSENRQFNMGGWLAGEIVSSDERKRLNTYLCGTTPFTHALAAQRLEGADA
jgi:hypothetical protein